MTIEDGSKEWSEMSGEPYISVDITAGRWPFLWTFTVSAWLKEEKCWSHYYEFDGECFGLWRAHYKAEDAIYKLRKHLK